MSHAQSRQSRIRASIAVRTAAAQAAADRPHPIHVANGDEQRYASAKYLMSFTKGLEHDMNGLLVRGEDFEAFRSAIDNGRIDAFSTDVPSAPTRQRRWEAPTAGVVFDLQGPDAQAVTMAPAPALGSVELAYELAEVYELAALRDEPLSTFEGAGNGAVRASVGRLNALPYKLDGSAGRARTNSNGQLNAQNIFRGSSPGTDVGPYVSQFMLMGNDVPGLKIASDGFIQYGAQLIDQRVPIALPTDFMIIDTDYLKVQNGENPRPDLKEFGPNPGRRFITTPRDLATYVHIDQLYQAYLNACLILLSMGAPFDPSFNNLSGRGPIGATRQDRAAGGFALFGGPHILSLVTEVATRALKAVRYQKFNNHIRLRPEALGARIHWADEIEQRFPCLEDRLSGLRKMIGPSINAARAASGSSTDLLPMAFKEGSPMHPAYGAGHATVAGACVTILKAFFDTDAVLVMDDAGRSSFRRVDSQPQSNANSNSESWMTGSFRPRKNKDELKWVEGPCLTVEGELNKLAANISIGRNMAGVHYFSDYYDSVRMGEEIAIGMLEEQALCYPTDSFVLSVPTFDGGVRRIGAR